MRKALKSLGLFGLFGLFGWVVLLELLSGQYNDQLRMRDGWPSANQTWNQFWTLFERQLRAQEAYPSRPVSVVVPFSTGSQPDVLARVLTEQMSKALGQSFVIINRDGASGIIAVESVAQAKSDGYTLGFGPQGQFTVQPHLRRNLRYKIDDFDFLCQTNAGAFAVAAGPRAPFNSLAELIEAGRRAPGKLSFASAGHATIPHLIAESIALEAGVNFNHVPFRAVGEMYAQVINGSVDFLVTTPIFLSTRKEVKGLAAVAEQPLSSHPNIPLLRDLGYTQSNFPGMLGLYAPKGLPAPASEALRKVCASAASSDPYKQMSEKIATPRLYADARDYAAAIARDAQLMAALLLKLGIGPE